MSLSAFAINCTLKPSDDEVSSSTDRMLGDLLSALEEHDVKGEIVRALDFDIRPGVLSDMGYGDEWPRLRRRISVCAD